MVENIKDNIGGLN